MTVCCLHCVHIIVCDLAVAYLTRSLPQIFMSIVPVDSAWRVRPIAWRHGLPRMLLAFARVRALDMQQLKTCTLV